MEALTAGVEIVALRVPVLETDRSTQTVVPHCPQALIAKYMYF